MAARPTSTREPSLLSVDSLSRRSSIASNPDIFSDDYALQPIDSNLNLSLVDSVDTDETLITSNITPYPAIPNRLSVHNRPSSTAKRSNRDEPASSQHDAASIRTSSTSSRFSRVRAQSPYRGPSRPTHPYNMYPQITRASSVASSSTIRPQERPFVHTGGPEHPYTLYPQNTVEDADEDIGTQPIPLGFSALGFGSPNGTSHGEVGDIVLSDGHIEQLPPYTRYADNVVAKGDMANINEPHHVVEMDTTSSERSSLIPGLALLSVQPTTAADRNDDEEEEEASAEEARKEGWKEKAHKRVCGGIALWLLVVIVAFVVFAGVIGGVIGGVVGRQQGATEAKNSGPATTTVYMDADPASTDSSTPTCPTGKYTIPFNQTQQIEMCVGNSEIGRPWGCLDFAFLGMTIGRTGEGNTTVQFDDYSIDTSQFLYGPQPPDFNGTMIPLMPHKDRDNEDLGVAMFFYQEFDKLIILPDYVLRPEGKRSLNRAEVLKRGAPWLNQPLQIGDEPWYCFWNKTISEFWIFLEEPANGTNDSSTSISGTSAAITPSPTSTTSATLATSHSPSNSRTTWMEAFIPPPWPTKYKNLGTADAQPTGNPFGVKQKRSYTAPYYPEYPKLIKMVEKRRPYGNIPPYCQKMKVMNGWSVVPNEKKQIIPINELEWEDHPIVAGTQRKRDTTQQLESNCVCEWVST